MGNLDLYTILTNAQIITGIFIIIVMLVVLSYIYLNKHNSKKKK